MTGFEAIKRAREQGNLVKIGRRGRSKWLPLDSNSIEIGDLFEEDWELEEKSVTVTRSQVEKAWVDAGGKIRSCGYEDFLKHLGLE